ncbi:MAG: PspA/IM30 family protein [Verrucomicrobiota bacterium JB023]|nr:PspA/IM30 family protein [Verrucomicrobiota bacterium JB023]
MFKRLGNLIKGFFGLFVGNLEKKNPEALLDVEKENLRRQIAEFNKGLAAHAGVVERLITQAKKLDREEDDLRAKTTANLKAGNRDAAGEYALKLKQVQKEHDEVKEQLEAAETRYQELTKARDVSVKEAKEKIDRLARDIDDMKVQKAMAELNEMAAGMVTEIGGAGDTLNRLEGIVEEERTKAAGRARVAKDQLDLGDIEQKAAEQDALADLALAEFAAAEGIEMETGGSASSSESPGSESTGSTMGPVKEGE